MPRLTVYENAAPRPLGAFAEFTRALNTILRLITRWLGDYRHAFFPRPPNSPSPLAASAALRDGAKLYEATDARTKRAAA